MTANFESLTPAKSMGMNIPKLVTALNKGSGANWSLSRWGRDATWMAGSSRPDE